MNNKIVKLDEKDKKIIKELYKNSRQSFSSIGKGVGLPKNVVAYRVKRMIDEGLITLFCTIINREKMGYTNFRLFLKFHHFNEELQKKLLETLKNIKNIHWVASLDGNFDICVIFLSKNLEEINLIYEKIVYQFDSFILDKEFSMQTKSYHLPYNFMYGKTEEKINIRTDKKNNSEIDNLDKDLINLIIQNSRISLLELIEKLKLSPQTIRSRIKNLQKKGIIIGFKIRLDPSFLNLNNFHTFLYLTGINKDKEKEIINYIASFASTIKIIKSIGRWDLEFESLLPSHFELHNVLKDLKDKFPKNINKIDSALIYKIHDINTVRY